MSVFKSLCFSLVLGIFLGSNISMAQEIESAEAMVKKGLKYDKQKDYQQAMQWYLKAADEGNTDAMVNIGLLYQHGNGVQQNYQQAMQWYLKAADKNNPIAMIQISRLYNEGLGVDQDTKQGMAWFVKAQKAHEAQKAK